MRQFATIQSIVDLQGYPVSGDRLLFLVDDEQLATITDKDGNEISNPVKIVNGHTEVQVFLPDVDVKIVQQTLVDSELGTWSPVGYWWDKAPAVSLNVAVGTPSVGTIAELKQLDPSVGSVNLLGYNIAGDKPVINYRWHSVSSAAINIYDDGYMIKSDVAQGGWAATFADDFVDVRHYGIFPASLSTASQYSAIASAYTRLTAIGKKLYFPYYKGYSHYNISGLSISNAKTDTNVVLFASGSQADLYDCGNVKVYGDGNTSDVFVYADTVYVSQNYNNSTKVHLLPRDHLIVDKDNGLNTLYKNVFVSLSVNVTKNARFNNCTIMGSGKFNPSEGESIVLERCIVNRSSFADGCDFSRVSFSKCESEINSWSSADEYLEFAVFNSDNEIDMKGAEVTAFPTLDADRTIILKNAVVNHTCSDSVISSNIRFRNCTFKNNSISNFFDCEGCVFERNARCVTDATNNTSGTVTGRFVGCFFTGENSHIVMDFGTSARSEMGILALVVKDCVFNNVSPVNGVWHGGETEQARLIAIKELDISNLFVTGCIGNTWGTDTFIVRKGINPASTIPQTSGAQILAEVDFPFEKCKSLWEMETALYFDQGSSKIRETSASVRKFVGTYEYLRTATVNGATPEIVPSIVVAYAKIRRIV